MQWNQYTDFPLQTLIFFGKLFITICASSVPSLFYLVPDYFTVYQRSVSSSIVLFPTADETVITYMLF
jgi:hypothetical protein